MSTTPKTGNRYERDAMSAAITKDADPHRLLSADERDILRQAAEELRARAHIAFAHADRLETARTVGDALAVEMSWDNELATLDEHERR